MADIEPVPLSPEVKAQRAASFGGAAAHYERYRPGPPMDAVRWILPSRVHTAVDLGAGTGALSRLLVDRADEVIAVEPDDRMRAVLTEGVPGVRAVAGRAESMPLPDATVDAVIASSSWHWVDPEPALHEVGRVLVDGGTVAAVWSGPDRESPFMAQAASMLAGGSGEGGGGGGLDLDDDLRDELARAVNDPVAIVQALEIPPGTPFDEPEHTILQWDAPLDAEDLVGLLGTFSWVILMREEARTRLLEAARTALAAMLGTTGATIDVGFRADVWKARRHDR
ncbi:MAG TPA: class I SAM-dependent methyltransferase [Acidimicrobiales bacterium]|nr:class I SAM-dependent methyltransferase [Acidimicrobiales bacterium]